MLIATLLLAAALASYGYFLRGGGVGWPRPAAPRTRARHFARTAARNGVLFGAVSLVLLASAGRLDALVRLPREFGPAQDAIGGAIGPMIPLGWLAGSIATGMLIGAGLSRVTRRRIQIGKLGAVMPRSAAELRWGVLLALTGGVAEELFFRLALPLLIALASGQAVAGFVVATLLFAAAHRYQGWAGVIATGLVGALLAYAYLATGSLALVIALHVLLDLNALVVRPVLAGDIRLTRAR